MFIIFWDIVLVSFLLMRVWGYFMFAQELRIGKLMTL